MSGDSKRDPESQAAHRAPELVDPSGRAEEAMALLRDRERGGRGSGSGLEHGAPSASDEDAPANPPETHPEGAELSADAPAWSPRWTGVGSKDLTELPYPDPAESTKDSETERVTSVSPVPLASAGCDPTDPRFETTDDPRIPEDSESFRIGEVARIVGVKAHVLRFWETEFEWVRPDKTEAKQRRYQRTHVAHLLQIRRLRHDAQLTVAQTRACIQAARDSGQAPTPALTSVPVPASVAQEDLSIDKLRARLADMRTAVVELLAVVEEP